MKSNLSSLPRVIIFLAGSVLLFTGCITAAKIDKYVAGQYGNRLPGAGPSGKDNIRVTSTVVAPFDQVSSTMTVMDHFLPLLFYWQGDHKHICTLNPGIFVNKFTGTISAEARRRLASKLGDRTLELTLTQLPHAFTLGDKWHAVWVVFYLIQWHRTYARPDPYELVVAYKVLQDDSIVKSGTLSIPNGQQEERLGMFQSWKSAASSQISSYNHLISNMSRACVDRLAKEL